MQHIFIKIKSLISFSFELKLRIYINKLSTKEEKTTQRKRRKNYLEIAFLKIKKISQLF